MILISLTVIGVRTFEPSRNNEFVSELGLICNANDNIRYISLTAGAKRNITSQFSTKLHSNEQNNKIHTKI